jgi:hypothetical protein
MQETNLPTDNLRLCVSIRNTRNSITDKPRHARRGNALPDPCPEET